MYLSFWNIDESFLWLPVIFFAWFATKLNNLWREYERPPVCLNDSKRGVNSRFEPRGRVSLFPTSWAFSSFMQPEHFFQRQILEMVAKWKRLLCCVLVHCWGCAANELFMLRIGEERRKKEQRERKTKDESVDKHVWMQPLHCLKQFLYAKYNWQVFCRGFVRFSLLALAVKLHEPPSRYVCRCERVEKSKSRVNQELWP